MLSCLHSLDVRKTKHSRLSALANYGRAFTRNELRTAEIMDELYGESNTPKRSNNVVAARAHFLDLIILPQLTCIAMMLLVPGAGIEPALPSPGNGF